MFSWDEILCGVKNNSGLFDSVIQVVNEYNIGFFFGWEIVYIHLG